MLRSLLVITSVVCAALATAPAALGQVALTLTGEQLVGSGPATVDCGATPLDVSTVSYDATGTATGPYPGTFVESGTVTYDGAEVLTFHASFTIFSADTTITGTKSLRVVPGSGGGTCEPSDALAEVANVQVTEFYDAMISSPSGSFRDSGIGLSNIHGVRTFAGEEAVSMQQSFLSAGPEGATITLSPKTSVNPIGTTHTVTALVQNAAGVPVQGVAVLFVITGGPQTTSQSTCTTGATGTCDFTYLGPDFPSADEITGCIDRNRNFAIDAGEPCDVATKAWTAPASTRGSVAGGGYILDVGTGDRVVFGLSAHAADLTTPPHGSCSVIDTVARVHIRCLDATTIVVTPTHATFFGEAEQEGIATNYRIDVDDVDDSGQLDTFKIHTDLGYLAAGPLESGNVSIRP